MQVRISPTLAAEYESRGMAATAEYEHGPNPYAKVRDGGVIEVDATELAELLADARFQSDPYGPLTDRCYFGLRNAYAALVRQIVKLNTEEV